MTANQIAYWNLQELNRSNVAKETETNRSNLVKEQETKRSNLANEALTRQRDRNNYDIAIKNYYQTKTMNQWQRNYQERSFWENRRHTLVQEQQAAKQIENASAQTSINAFNAQENQRTNKQRELLSAQQLEETTRNNLANESIQQMVTMETHRSHLVNEALESVKQAEISSNNLRTYQQRNNELRYHFATLAETSRHNLAQEKETSRSNRTNEALNMLTLLSKAVSSASKVALTSFVK